MTPSDAASPSTPIHRLRFIGLLLTALPGLLLGVAVGVLCYCAAGTTLGFWFGGVLLATLVVPPLVSGEDTPAACGFVTLTTATGIAAVWLACVLREGTASDTRMTDWLACTGVLIAYVLALAGVVLALLRLRAAPALASTLALILGLAWLTWPIWLSTALAGHDRITLLLAAAHPLLAINATLRHLGLWQQQHLAYTLTNLNQDVALPLPSSVLPAIALHALLGAALAMGAARWRRRTPSQVATVPGDVPTASSANAV